MGMSRDVAIITGGNQGIGAATAVALAGNGARVVVAGRTLQKCEEIVEVIRAGGGEAAACVCDVTCVDQVDALVETALSRFGHVNILVNSAGTMEPIGYTDQCAPDEWAQCIAVNLVGSFYTSRVVLPHFRTQGSGVIVNMSSGAAFVPLEGWGAYCSAKSGLAMLTRVLTAETASTDIRIYGFQPGMVNTETTRDALKQKVNRVASLDPETFDPPEAPAAAIAWLCRERPEDMSGCEVDFTNQEFRRRFKAEKLSSTGD